MKVCLIGKYPPIEGGVSASTYWLSHGLAERGHQVFVVTNAGEVESAYRMHLQPSDRDWYEPCFPGSGGAVSVHEPEPFSMARMDHIPVANPFVTKLAGLATQVIREQGCDALLASYYEPYAVAAFLASSWTGCPLIVHHAGSDLDRLMKVAELATTYKEILRSADRVLTHRGLIPRFLGMGVPAERIRLAPRFALPPQVFHPDTPPLDVAAILAGAAPADNGSVTGPDLSKPTIGIYGKVGTFKGSYDLLEALSQLADDGADFNFLAMTQGWQADRFAEQIKAKGLSERTWLLPFLPHWRVPAFIRVCTAVCFLERDFPIAIHGPIVPREILACGTCLIVSGEIVSKSGLQRLIVPGENALVVPDPKNHEDLVATLRWVTHYPDEARAIGARGRSLSARLEDYPAYIDGYETILQQVRAGELPTEEPAAVETTAERLGRRMPHVRLLLGDRYDELVADFAGEGGSTASGASDFRLALEFCDFLLAKADEVWAWERRAVDVDVVRYQRARLRISFDDEEDRRPAYPAPDVLGGQPINAETVGDLVPLRATSCAIEAFAHDVTAFFSSAGDDADSLPAAGTGGHEEPAIIAFCKLPNLSGHELRLNAATRDLLALCDGQRTTSAIVQALAEQYGLEDDEVRAALRARIISALQRLYSLGVIIFTHARTQTHAPPHAPPSAYAIGAALPVAR